MLFAELSPHVGRKRLPELWVYVGRTRGSTARRPVSSIVLGPSTLLVCREGPDGVWRRKCGRLVWEAAVVILTEELLLVVQIAVYVRISIVTVLYRFPLDVVRGSSW
jgi:hypothetical protein